METVMMIPDEEVGYTARVLKGEVPLRNGRQWYEEAGVVLMQVRRLLLRPDFRGAVETNVGDDFDDRLTHIARELAEYSVYRLTKGVDSAAHFVSFLVEDLPQCKVSDYSEYISRSELASLRRETYLRSAKKALRHGGSSCYSFHIAGALLAGIPASEIGVSEAVGNMCINLTFGRGDLNRQDSWKEVSGLYTRINAHFEGE